MAQPVSDTFPGSSLGAHWTIENPDPVTPLHTIGVSGGSCNFGVQARPADLYGSGTNMLAPRIVQDAIGEINLDVAIQFDPEFTAADAVAGLFVRDAAGDELVRWSILRAPWLGGDPFRVSALVDTGITFWENSEQVDPPPLHYRLTKTGALWQIYDSFTGLAGSWVERDTARNQNIGVLGTVGIFAGNWALGSGASVHTVSVASFANLLAPSDVSVDAALQSGGAVMSFGATVQVAADAVPCACANALAVEIDAAAVAAIVAAAAGGSIVDATVDAQVAAAAAAVAGGNPVDADVGVAAAADADVGALGVVDADVGVAVAVDAAVAAGGSAVEVGIDATVSTDMSAAAGGSPADVDVGVAVAADATAAAGGSTLRGLITSEAGTQVQLIAAAGGSQLSAALVVAVGAALLAESTATLAARLVAQSAVRRGLRYQAETDLRSILSDLSGFAWPIVVRAPDGSAASLTGLSTDIELAVDPETGQLVTGRRASVAISLSDLQDGGLGIPEAVASRTSKPWLIEFADILGRAGVFRVDASAPDRAIGLVVCILGRYR